MAAWSESQSAVLPTMSVNMKVLWPSGVEATAGSLHRLHHAVKLRTPYAGWNRSFDDGKVEMLATQPFLNTDLYSVPKIVFYFAGFYLWTPAYVSIVRRGFRTKQLEEPMLAVCGNIAWEFYWGLFVHLDMGWALKLCYVGGFLLDCFILYWLYRVGWKQSRSVDLRRLWPLIVTATLVALVAFYATFQRNNYDLPLGSNSAYLDNIMVSGLYLWFGLSRHPDDMSLTVAWSKMLGTGLVSVFVFWEYPDNGFIHTLAIITAVLDLAYFALLLRRRRDHRLGTLPPSVQPASGSSVQPA